MNTNKRILSIQDISCVGQCSLTVALPIISAAGIETSILPSAVLSTHTGGSFTGFTFRDLTEDLPLINKHWISKNITFDCIYTGYIGNKNQIEYILNIIDSTLKPSGKLIVDPAMADNGKLYPGFDSTFVEYMSKLCSKADVIIPNLTEASFLLKKSYIESYSQTYLEEILTELAQLGPKTVILTGVNIDGKYGVAIYSKDTKTTSYYFHEKVPYSFHGTGDVFASAFTGAVMNGLDYYKAASIAADFTLESIKKTIPVREEHWYGVLFEKAIPYYISRLD